MSRLSALLLKSESPTEIVMRCVKAALDEARDAHPTPYVDAHHMLGVMEEEIHELKMEVYRKRIRPERVQSELLQIAAVAVRGIEDMTLPNAKAQPRRNGGDK